MILHKKRVAANRPDGVDVTVTRGISNWDDDHVAPPLLAYSNQQISSLSYGVPNANMPDTELAGWRSKYDFTYCKEARLILGCDYGSAKIYMKHSGDLVTWRPLDGVSGPFITQTQGAGNATVYASPWVTLETLAKGDRWLALFYHQNFDRLIIQLATVTLQVR
jgi:hypothetical protein